MSAGRIVRRSPPREAASPATTLNLPAGSVTIRKNGIEFVSAKPLAPWTEVTLDIESPLERRKVTCRGVVVACDGNRHAGYQVALLFLGLTPQIQQRLESLALSDLRQQPR
jgi:hypothetical protein